MCPSEMRTFEWCLFPDYFTIPTSLSENDNRQSEVTSWDVKLLFEISHKESSHKGLMAVFKEREKRCIQKISLEALSQLCKRMNAAAIYSSSSTLCPRRIFVEPVSYDNED